MMQTEISHEDVRPQGHEAQLIAVASGKGGVGKTWLSISLAQAMAHLDRRVLLFDGDLGLANVDIQLGLNPERDLGEVLAGRRDLEAVTLACAAGGFDVVAGRSGSGSLANLPGDKLEHLAAELRRQAAGYDRVILDLGGTGIERGESKKVQGSARTTDRFAYRERAAAGRQTAAADPASAGLRHATVHFTSTKAKLDGSRAVRFVNPVEEGGIEWEEDFDCAVCP